MLINNYDNQKELLHLKYITTSNKKKLLTKKLRAIIKENCEGCEQDYPSQTDHACLMDGENQATAFFQDAFPRLLQQSLLPP